MDRSADVYLKSDNWWTSRSSLEKRLSVLSVVLFVILTLTITYAALVDYEDNGLQSFIRSRRVSSGSDSNMVRHNVLFADPKSNKAKGKRNSSSMCVTPTCIEMAHAFLSTIDQSVSPCHDFYRFSCGKWLNNSIIPDNRISISTSGIVVETMEMQFRAMLEEPIRAEDPVFFRNIKHIYTSCMNFTQLQYLADEPLIETLLELGGWPVSQGMAWSEEGFDWVDLSLRMKAKGLPFNEFYHIAVGADIKDTTKHIITIGEVMPGVGSRKAMLLGLNDPHVRTYFELLVESASLLRAQQFNPNLFNELMQLIDFQIRMVNWTTPLEEARDLDKAYNKMSVRDLQSLAPNTEWIKLLSGLLDRNIKTSDKVIVNNPNYVKQIDFMISQSSNRLLANHMIADVILTAMPLLSAKWLQLHDFYLHRVTGRKEVPPRWHQCIKSAATLNVAFSALYVRKYFKSESKLKAESMVRFIHKEFIKMLDKVDWMDKQTRRRAMHKANTISSHIGFPKQLLNDTQIADLYRNLGELSDHLYYDNMLRLSKFSNDQSAHHLGRPRVKRDWRNFADAAVVNAYYSAVENAIIFPAGILQGAFFNYNNPDYVNFGAIGTVIAHEITHAFDDIGKQFDSDGNYNNWWNNRTDQRFKSRAQCLVDQYSSYVLENGMKFSSINTLGENIADNVGVREAFKAYKAYAGQRPPQQTLPGLDYTPEQLFWITFGNIWCTRTRPEMYRMILEKETHSPAQFRVIGSLSNAKEFAQSFNCPVGSRMNPEKKCNVW